ncbi:MAG: hypothetical protein NTZ17_14040 [Phycisphaerae bacterium]|nr:hypothetical protein [Phycisphaerae bacterium]
MDAREQDEVNTTKTGKTRRPRKWLRVLVGLVVLLLVVMLLIPVILSSKGFTRWVQAKISSSTGGQADIRALSVGWFRGVQIAGFSYRGDNGGTAVDIDRITAMPDYASLLTGTLALDRTVIDQPQVAIDLREQPPSSNKSTTVDLSGLERIGKVAVHDGSIRLTDTAGKMVQLASLNSDLSLRSPGRTSSIRAGMAVLAAAQKPGHVTVAGEVTPGKKTGWTLKGTTGDVTVEVNDLNLDSIAPFLELAGLQVQAKGQVSGNITSALQDGQLQNLNATITGQDLDITGKALQGDRLRTSQLSVKAKLTQSGEVINVNQLDARTDWATVSLTGTVPKTPGSLSGLLESGSAYDVRGNFDISLAAVLSQMPNTVGVHPGMQITGGRATGSINTTTQGGRATITAKAQVAELAGVVDNQKISLSAPVQTALQLSTGTQGAQLDNLSVTAPFATVSASGSFQQINYQGQTDLALLQSQLGPFMNLGPYKLAGQVATKGQVSITDKITSVTGNLSARQLVLASADGNSVSEPQATVDFTLSLDQQKQAVAVQNLTASAAFGTLGVKNATVPMGSGSLVPLNVVVTATNVDLSKLEPYGVLFASVPKTLTVAGIAQSQVTITQKQTVYRLTSDATRIQNLRVVSPGNPPFQQPQVTANFDVYVDPNQKTIDLQNLRVESQQIKIQKGRFTQTTQGSTVKAQGTVEAQVDWAALAPLAATFVPGQLSIAGQRQIALDFTSTYPARKPNGLLAHLNGQGSLGFDSAAYMGFDFGSTQLEVRAQDGLVTIGPVATTVNNGKLNFTGDANFRQPPGVLATQTLVHMAQGVQINQQTAQTLLKYVNPLFADAVSVSGTANFDVRQMAIPLQGSHARDQAQLDGTIWIDQLQLGTSGILNQILSVVGQSTRGQVLTVHPTALVLQKGVLRYDDMQIDIGQNPVNFRGSIGLDGTLNMTVVLPYTLTGRLVRVGQPEMKDRIVVPLTGTVNKPQLNLQNLVKSQLQEQVMKGIDDLLKKR